MFNMGITSIQDAVEKIREVKDDRSFSFTLAVLRTFLRSLDIDPKCLLELEQCAYHPVNRYSDRETRAELEAAQQRVIVYLEQLMDRPAGDERIEEILENYYLFLEALLERPTHKSGGIQKEHLAALRIQNEYDVQHLLYAYLKPLYPMARAEVSEDTGHGAVRADIQIDPEHIIEVKCTRGSMKLKKLSEEIGADMVHYSAHNIYFFIYDKEKIIRDPLVFKNSYENKIEGKRIHIIIHQPKIL